MQLYCKTADYNAVTGTCSAPFYGPAQGLLPNLSVAEGLAISGGLIFLWGLGFIGKQSRKAITT